MRLYRRLADFKGSKRGIALAIGNFDGFHQGHRAVIEAMKSRARALDLDSAVMIFEPQPSEYFGKAVPSRLYSLRDKLKVFKNAGLDAVFCMSFNDEFSQLSPQEFVIDLLWRKLNVKSVTVGSLFSFGRGGLGNFAKLKALACECGMEAQAIGGVASGGERISSTAIRELLKNGDLEHAMTLLGRPYAMSGKVVRGRQIGRDLGFPTANVNINRRVCPLRGVYAVRANTPYGRYDGIANVGIRPTVGDLKERSILEVYLFDFDHDLYGRAIEVLFVKKIRDERKFADLDALREQIKADADYARSILRVSSI